MEMIQSNEKTPDGPQKGIILPSDQKTPDFISSKSRKNIWNS